jgi:photosystem II stability/assembly factor-like uncharacterized protein
MRRPIAAILALLFVGGIIAVLVGVIGTIVSLNSGSTNVASDMPVPPGWSKHYSSDGLSLTVEPNGFRISGVISPALAKLNDKVTIQYWPEGAFRTLTKDEESNYKGYVDPGIVTAYVGPDGRFEADSKWPPPAIRVNGELRLTEPGHHWYVLILDDKHAIFAPFEVTVPRPIPTVSQAPYLSANASWFLDSKTGWLSATSCRKQPRPTPDQYNNDVTLPPDVCKPALYGTTDGGHAWQLLYHGTVEGFRFSGQSVGVAYNNAGSCPHGPCRSQILRTTDGGRTWTQTYHPLLSLGNLTIVGGEAWLVGNDCDDSTPRASCTSYLLRSVDGGATWIQTTLPVAGRPYLSMSRPTQHDAFATVNYDHQGGPGVLLATHDSGATWTSSALPADLFEGQLVSFRTATDGWLLSGGQPAGPFQSKLFYRTRDGGATWIKVSGREELGSAGYIEPLTFAGEQSIWMPVVHFGLRHSTDGGKTWKSLTVDGRIAAETEDQQAVIRFTDQQHGWTMTNYFTPPPSFQQQQALWATSDGGTTWQELPLPPPENP